MPGKRVAQTRPIRFSLPKVAGAGALVALGSYLLKGIHYRKTAERGFELANPPAPGTDEFARLIEAVAQAPIREGNHLQVMRNGNQIFPSMVEAIRSASHTVNFSTYIYWTGAATVELAEVLSERARAGIEVNVLLDAWGSALVDRDLVKDMKRAGVKVAWFRPPRWYELKKFNNRMHRRILVIDGRVGFTGGVGIAEEWEGNTDDPDHWRETHIRVDGPAARDLTGAFLENWVESTGTMLGGWHLPSVPSHDDGVAVQVTRSSPTSGSTATEEIFLAAILGARERLWITTAYFAPRKAFVDALCAAARRAVDLRILVNGRSIDKQVVRTAGKQSYGPLLECGTRIFEYQRAMLHAKVLIVDDSWVNVGSANFDNRSFALQHEINLCARDRDMVVRLEKHFLEDLDDSEEYLLGHWRERSIVERVRGQASELVRHTL